jgi:aryl-alcohol dehydrogenase-like predicted oxidoreductase
MERRRLGASGLEVSKLSLGAMTFGTGMPPITTVDRREARVMIDRALAAGVNLIDTADVYANGQSEEILGEALRGRRDDVLVATKMGFGTREPGALSYANVVAACEASLRRLGTDRIDLYSCTGPTAPRRSRRPWARSRTSSPGASCARPAPATSAPSRPRPRWRANARSVGPRSPPRSSTTRWSDGRPSTS